MTDPGSGDWQDILHTLVTGEATEPTMEGTLVVNDPSSPWPSRVRVSKSRGRYRVESMDGEVLTIHTPTRTIVFEPDQDVPDQYDHGLWGVVGVHSEAIERRDPFDWTLDDFTVPAKPPVRTNFLEFQAWEIELAPPRHKPAPLVLVVDAVHGMTYSARSLAFGNLYTWTSIQVVEELPENLFEYDGPTRRR